MHTKTDVLGIVVLVLMLPKMVITSVWNTRANTGVLWTKRPTPTRTQSPFNFLSFISIDLPDVFHSTPLLSRVVCISLLSTTTSSRFESTFSSRSAHSRVLRRIFYLRTNERTNKILRRRKKKQKKKKSFVLSIVFVLRAHTRTRPRTNTTPRPRVSRRRRRRRRRHGRGRATIKFVVDAFFDACAFQSPRVDTRGGGETQNVFSF